MTYLGSRGLCHGQNRSKDLFVFNVVLKWSGIKNLLLLLGGVFFHCKVCSRRSSSAFEVCDRGE